MRFHPGASVKCVARSAGSSHTATFACRSTRDWQAQDDSPRGTNSSVCDSDDAKDHFRAGRPALEIGLTADRVEKWQRFPHLHHGYRRGGDHLACLWSLLKLHNETINAWTMIVSSVVGQLLFFTTFFRLSCSWRDAAPFVAVYLGQSLHGPISCSYHTFMCISPEVANTWRKLDLSFILVLNTLASFGLSYFTFGPVASLAWTLAVAIIAARGIHSVRQLQPAQSLDRKRLVGLIGLTALGYYVPLLVRGVGVYMLTGRAWPELGICLTVLGCHAVGATTYATHWPQRQFPGVFDLVGFSHNLMHLFCFAAYNCAYPYISHLYLNRHEWSVLG